MTTTLEAPVTRNSINVHGAMEGDILVATWGYDQTNWDYYEVIHITSKTVTLFDLRHHTLLKGKRAPSQAITRTFQAGTVCASIPSATRTSILTTLKARMLVKTRNATGLSTWVTKALVVEHSRKRWVLHHLFISLV